MFIGVEIFDEMGVLEIEDYIMERVSENNILPFVKFLDESERVSFLV